MQNNYCMEKMNIYGCTSASAAANVLHWHTDVLSFTRLSTIRKSLGEVQNCIFLIQSVLLADYNKEPWKADWFASNKEAITS